MVQQFFVHKTLTEPHKEGNILPKENLIIVRKIIEKGHSMGITIEELKKLDKNTYQIIDIRDENEVAHGAIPGAVATPADSIEGNENIDFSKKLVICCSRGRFSVEVAEGLEEKGMDAVSLEGGYIAWLLEYPFFFAQPPRRICGMQEGPWESE